MRHAEWMEYDERRDVAPERIDKAAIRFDGVVHSVPRPGRHHDVIRQIVTNSGVRTVAGATQGFVTTNGRFVDRHEALVIAIRMDQIIKKTGGADRLYTEDMW